MKETNEKSERKLEPDPLIKNGEKMKGMSVWGFLAFAVYLFFGGYLFAIHKPGDNDIAFYSCLSLMLVICILILYELIHGMSLSMNIAKHYHAYFYDMAKEKEVENHLLRMEVLELRNTLEIEREERIKRDAGEVFHLDGK